MPTSHIRDWIDYLQAFAPSIAACVAACVGLTQWYLQRQNLKQQLFEKRFRVYEKVRPYVFTMRNFDDAPVRTIDAKELSKTFKQDMAPARFLFGSDIAVLLE